jgi:hypothetical protein
LSARAAFLLAAAAICADAAAAPDGRIAAEPGHPRFGFTLTHYIARTDAEAECSRERTGGASVTADWNILRGYGDDGVHERVKAALANGVSQGARSVRTILWYRHAEDEQMARRRKDPLGLAVASDGALGREVIGNLLGYIDDARKAGFERFFVVIGPQGTANPKCRRKQWGDCFDERLLELNWKVVQQVHEAVFSSDRGIDVVLDVAPTACPSPAGHAILDKNLATASRFILETYKRKFDDRHFIASCGVVHARRDLVKVTGRVTLFQELGLKPAGLDVHIYETEPSRVTATLVESSKEAARLAVPLIVAETFYDHPNIFAAVRELKVSGKLGDLSDLLAFPRRTGSRCQIGVSAPYDLSPQRRALGVSNGN